MLARVIEELLQLRGLLFQFQLRVPKCWKKIIRGSNMFKEEEFWPQRPGTVNRSRYVSRVNSCVMNLPGVCSQVDGVRGSAYKIYLYLQKYLYTIEDWKLEHSEWVALFVKGNFKQGKKNSFCFLFYCKNVWEERSELSETCQIIVFMLQVCLGKMGFLDWKLRLMLLEM